MVYNVDMNKYFALTTMTGDMRLLYLGRFSNIGTAIEFADFAFTDIIWVLEERDFLVLVEDYNKGKDIFNEQSI